MTHLCLLLLACFLSGLLPVAAATAPAGDSLSRPNIIFVVADDMGYKDTGYSGKGIVARNALRHEPGHLIDIMASCIELSGAEYPARFADHDILPMEGRGLTGGFAADRKQERTLLFEHCGRAAIRKGPWKLVRAGDAQPWELYAIEKDRTELNDLSKAQLEKVRDLGELWEKEAKRTYIYPKPEGKKKKR